MTEEELLAMPLHSMRTIHKGCVNPITIVRVSGGWIYGCTFVPDKAAQERMVLIAQAELAKLQIRYQNGTE